MRRAEIPVKTGGNRGKSMPELAVATRPRRARGGVFGSRAKIVGGVCALHKICNYNSDPTIRISKKYENLMKISESALVLYAAQAFACDIFGHVCAFGSPARLRVGTSWRRLDQK